MSKYWERRMGALEAARSKRAGKLDAEIEREYRRAQRSVQKDIDAFYGRFADGNGGIGLADAKRLLSSGELEEFKWDVDEYIARGRENAVTRRWMGQLENASNRVRVSRLEALQTSIENTMTGLFGKFDSKLADVLGETYETDYYRTAFEVQKALGTGWNVAQPDPALLEKVLSKPWTSDGRTFSDKIWGQQAALTQNVFTQLTQAMLIGDPPDRAIADISKMFGASRAQAGRLIMTESAYFGNLAQKDAYKECGVKEVEILETLDAKTCPACGRFDGARMVLSKVVIGETAPPYHPNCRGCIAPFFDDMEGERVARGNKGKTFHVQADTSFDEWKALTFGEKSGILELPDFETGASLSAAAAPIWVRFGNGEYVKVVEGEPIKNIKVFAGKGAKTVFRDAARYAKIYGGDARDWQKVKGRAVLDYNGKHEPAEIHWVQAQGIGQKEHKFKGWDE